MTFLPIIERELRVRARQKATCRMRSMVAFIALLLSALILSTFSRFNNPASGGAYAYEFLSVVAFGMACGATLITADSLSTERREGTLGFLFLTDLNGYDVIFGKLTSNGLAMFYAMLALVPSFALSLLAGGVTLGQVFRAALACLNVLFVALSLGICVSTKPQTQFAAMCRAALILMGLLILPELAGQWILPAVGSGFSIAMLSPAESLRYSEATSFSFAPTNYWNSLLVSHLTGWLFLTLAVRRIKRNWRDQIVEEHRKVKAIAAPAGNENLAASSPQRVLGVTDPVCWRVSRMRGQKALMWAAALLGASNSLWWMPASFLGIVFGGIFGALSFIGSTASAAVFASAASRFFQEARRSGELELLLSTPVGAKQIISGQWAALWQQLRWPLALMLCSLALPMIASVIMQRFPYGLAGYSILRLLLSAANLVLGVLAVIWMGMWFGLRKRNSLMAVSWTVGLVKGLPWLVSSLWSAGMAFVGFAFGSVRGGLSLGFTLIHLTLPVLTLLLNVFYIRWARGRLHEELSGRFNLNFSWQDEAQAWAGKFRRLRHWTPS